MDSLDFLNHISSYDDIYQYLSSKRTDSDIQNVLLLKSLWKIGSSEEKEALTSMLLKLAKDNKSSQVNFEEIQSNIRKGYGKFLMFIAVLKTAFRSFNHITNSFYKIALKTSPHRKPGKE